MGILQDQDQQGIKRCVLKTIDSGRIFLFFVIGFLTAGIFWVCTFWFPSLYFYLYRDEEDVWKADYILFTRSDNSRFLIQIKRKKCKIGPDQETRFYMFFRFLGQLYYYEIQRQQFIQIKGQLEKALRNNTFSKQNVLRGLEKKVVRELRDFYGFNEMRFQTNSFLKQFSLETLDPINFVQILLSICFFLINRIIYGGAVLLMVLLTIYQAAREYARNNNKLKKMAQIDQKVRVVRRLQNSEYISEVEERDLVVGDLIELEQNQVFQSDMILVQGSCLVNEALLTGESVPILKTSYSFDSKEIKDNCKLMSGTQLVHQKSEILRAVIIGTGWNTAKGLLIGSVVFSQKTEDRFRKDFLKTLFTLSALQAIIAILYIFFHLDKPYFGFYWIFPYYLDLFRNCFPPLVFFIMAYSVKVSSNKLSKKKIYSLKSNKIIEAGAVKQICFDKTGTLTKLEIRIYGFILNGEDGFDQLTGDIRDLQYQSRFARLIQGISTCHSLEKIKESYVGDPLEEELFKHLECQIQVVNKWANLEGEFNCICLPRFLRKRVGLGKDQKFIQVGISEFTSRRKRMSIVSFNESNGKATLFCKGAPEVLKNLCQESSLPDNYDAILQEFSEQGYRILALASKPVQWKNQVFSGSEIDRLENQLDFLGFLLFENPLKETTKLTINQLKINQFKVAMITGDNIYTAVNVAYQSGILKHSQSVNQCQIVKNKLKWSLFDPREKINPDYPQTLSIVSSLNQTQILPDQKISKIFENCIQSKNAIALTGDAFEKICEELQNQTQALNELLQFTKVFARASARQKELIIEKYKTLYNLEDSYVAFVGDGSNDALALKTANVGLSIGNDQASFSASFFTQDSQISSVKEIIIEGKACLGNAFQNFSFLIILLHSTAISLFIFSLNNWNYVDLDYIQGIFYSFPATYFMIRSATNEKLTRLKQRRTLFEFQSIFRIFVQIISISCIAVGIFVFLSFNQTRKSYPDITREANSATMNQSNYFFVESKLIYLPYILIVSFQSLVSYQGLPFKRPYYENKFLIFVFALNCCIFIVQLYADFFFEEFPEIFKFYKKYSRFPEFPDLIRQRYLIVAILLIFIHTLSMKIFKFQQLKKIEQNSPPPKPIDFSIKPNQQFYTINGSSLNEWSTNYKTPNFFTA